MPVLLSLPFWRGNSRVAWLSERAGSPSRAVAATPSAEYRDVTRHQVMRCVRVQPRVAMWDINVSWVVPEGELLRCPTPRQT